MAGDQYKTMIWASQDLSVKDTPSQWYKLHNMEEL